MRRIALATALGVLAAGTSVAAQGGAMARGALTRMRVALRLHDCHGLDASDPVPECSVTSRAPDGAPGTSHPAAIVRTHVTGTFEMDHVYAVIDAPDGPRAFPLGSAYTAGIGASEGTIAARARYEDVLPGGGPELVVSVRVAENDEDAGECHRTGHRDRQIVVCTLGDHPACAALPEYRDHYDETYGGCEGVAVRRVHDGYGFDVHLADGAATFTSTQVVGGAHLELTRTDPAEIEGTHPLDALLARTDLALAPLALDGDALPPALVPSSELDTALRTCSRHARARDARLGACLCRTACRVSVVVRQAPEEDGVSIRIPFTGDDALEVELDAHGRARRARYTAPGVDVQHACEARAPQRP